MGGGEATPPPSMKLASKARGTELRKPASLTHCAGLPGSVMILALKVPERSVLEKSGQLVIFPPLPPLPASGTTLSNPQALSPNSPPSGRLRKDGAIQAQPWLARASRSLRGPGDRNGVPGSKVQASPRLPRGWQMQCRLPQH